MTILRDALADPDTRAAVVTALVTDIATDGTITIDYGTGAIPGAFVLSTYTPALGDSVQAMRRDPSTWLVLGSTRTSNATTQTIQIVTSVPYNVLPNAGGSSGSLTVPAASTGSWRSADGWSQTAPYQGAYSPSHGLYTGCYFYGSSAFSSVAGRMATSLTIHLHRHNGAGTGGIGSGGAVNQYLALHAHPTQPGGQPRLVTPTLLAVALSDASNTATVTLPTSWGQMLVDGRAAGVAHYSGSAGDYSRCQTLAEDSTTGRLVLGWTT